jgi:hypothetical protein
VVLVDLRRVGFSYFSVGAPIWRDVHRSFDLYLRDDIANVLTSCNVNVREQSEGHRGHDQRPECQSSSYQHWHYKKDLLEKRFLLPGDRIDFDDLARDLRAAANHLLYPQLADVAVGAAVAFSTVDCSAEEKTADSIANSGATCDCFPYNGSVSAEVSQAAGAAANKYGCIDVLISNAGIQLTVTRNRCRGRVGPVHGNQP